jgi:hypothetical protein
MKYVVKRNANDKPITIGSVVNMDGHEYEVLEDNGNRVLITPYGGWFTGSIKPRQTVAKDAVEIVWPAMKNAYAEKGSADYMTDDELLADYKRMAGEDPQAPARTRMEAEMKKRGLKVQRNAEKKDSNGFTRDQHDETGKKLWDACLAKGYPIGKCEIGDTTAWYHDGQSAYPHEVKLNAHPCRSCAKVNFGKKIISMVNAVVHGTRPKKYECRFMAPGLTNYPGEAGGQEKWLISRDTMTAMQNSFIGCPVVAETKHEAGSVPDDFDQRVKKGDYDGVITGVRTNAADGWDYAEFIVWDPQVQEQIEKDGFNVSCAYNTLESLPGGVYNAIPYDAEVAKGEYIHMAIVGAPRQTGARIFLNSIDKELTTDEAGAIMFAMNGANYKLYPKGKINAGTGFEIRPDGVVEKQIKRESLLRSIFNLKRLRDGTADYDTVVKALEGTSEQDLINIEDAMKREPKKNSYGNFSIDSDIQMGKSEDEIIKNIMDRYSHIPREQAKAIYDAVKAGGADAKADWEKRPAGGTYQGSSMKNATLTPELIQWLKNKGFVKGGEPEAEMKKLEAEGKWDDIIKQYEAGAKTNAPDYKVGEQFFIAGGKGPKGKQEERSGYTVEFLESDEYPQGTPGWWVKVLSKIKKNEGGNEMEKCNKCGMLKSECNCNALELDPETAVIATPEGDVPMKDMINAYRAQAKKNAEDGEKEEYAHLTDEAKKHYDDAKAAGKSHKEAIEEAASKSGPKKENAGDKKIGLDDEFEGVKVSDMYNAYKAMKNEGELKEGQTIKGKGTQGDAVYIGRGAGGGPGSDYHVKTKDGIMVYSKEEMNELYEVKLNAEETPEEKKAREEAEAKKNLRAKVNADFGSVEWQNEKVKEIQRKTSAGEKLTPEEEVFIEVQKEHNDRIAAETKKNADDTRRAALKEEGKTDDEIETIMKSESEATDEERKRKEAEEANKEKTNHFNSLANARNEFKSEVPTEKKRISRSESIRIAKTSKQY